MKPSTIVKAAGAFCATFGLAGTGISLVSTNPVLAGGFAIVAAAGTGLYAAADVLAASGNGN